MILRDEFGEGRKEINMTYFIANESNNSNIYILEIKIDFVSII